MIESTVAKDKGFFAALCANFRGYDLIIGHLGEIRTYLFVSAFPELKGCTLFALCQRVLQILGLCPFLALRIRQEHNKNMLFYGVLRGKNTLHCLSFTFFRFCHRHLEDTGKNGTEVGADKHHHYGSATRILFVAH